MDPFLMMSSSNATSFRWRQTGKFTRAHRHTYTHTYAHTHTRTHTNTHTHTHAHTCTHAHTYAHTHTFVLTRVSSQTCLCTIPSSGPQGGCECTLNTSHRPLSPFNFAWWQPTHVGPRQGNQKNQTSLDIILIYDGSLYMWDLGKVTKQIKQISWHDLKLWWQPVHVGPRQGNQANQTNLLTSF